MDVAIDEDLYLYMFLNDLTLCPRMQFLELILINPCPSSRTKYETTDKHKNIYLVP